MSKKINHDNPALRALHNAVNRAIANGSPVIVEHAPSEDWIERQVERKMDSLDRNFMGGALTQAEYDSAVRQIDAWAESFYRPKR